MCTERTALAPSPTAAATRFVEPWRTSPTDQPFAIPHNCLDGFYAAYWRRPTAYLQAEVRAGISVFARLDRDEVDQALRALRDDLETGTWQRRHGALHNLGELDLGYRVVVADLD